jgi:hypothetical protein
MFLPRKQWPWVAIAGVLAVTTLVLRWEGRVWFCECGELRFWISDPRSSHTSQHFFDPYSFTHMLHGLIFYWLLVWLCPKWEWPWRVCLALSLEAGWEILENSPIVIDRYRTMTAALGYSGDSVLNSLGDVLACLAGLLIASRFGWRVSVALFLVTEITLLVTIRDSLLLNVLMLGVNIEWLKAWQEGAASVPITPA